jgi:hypothetical protein
MIFSYKSILPKIVLLGFIFGCLQSCSVMETEFIFAEPSYVVKEVNNLMLDFQKLNKKLPVRDFLSRGRRSFSSDCFLTW